MLSFQVNQIPYANKQTRLHNLHQLTLNFLKQKTKRKEKNLFFGKKLKENKILTWEVSTFYVLRTSRLQSNRREWSVVITELGE